jgi:hypothetical protein
MLRERQEAGSISSAEQAMQAFGEEPTGAYYPTGTERAGNIAKCASED